MTVSKIKQVFASIVAAVHQLEQINMGQVLGMWLSIQ